MGIIKVRDTNVEKYIKKAIIKKDIKIDKIKELFEFYNDKLLRTFLQAFMKNFDKTCILFNYFYIKLAKDINIHDFYGHSFFLQI